MGLALEGTLNMPYPDDPAEMDVVTWMQARNAMRDAWAEIERLRVMAYQPTSRHEENCLCAHCVPF